MKENEFEKRGKQYEKRIQQKVAWRRKQIMFVLLAILFMETGYNTNVKYSRV